MLGRAPEKKGRRQREETRKKQEEEEDEEEETEEEEEKEEEEDDDAEEEVQEGRRGGNEGGGGGGDLPQRIPRGTSKETPTGHARGHHGPRSGVWGLGDCLAVCVGDIFGGSYKDDWGGGRPTPPNHRWGQIIVFI